MTDETAISYHKGAVFTVELGALVESGFDLKLGDYPIFDEAYREGLNAKIIDHFWFREIGFETPALFRRFLRRKLNEVMPYYNQLYETSLAEIDPMSNYRQTREGGRKTSAAEQRSGDTTTTYSNSRSEDATSATTSQTEGRGRTVNSLTPQMQLSGNEDYASSIVDTGNDSLVDGTATNQSKGTDAGSSSATTGDSSTAQGTEDYVERVSGLVGVTGAAALTQWRQSLINIDMMVVSELDELFMGLYTDYWNGF